MQVNVKRLTFSESETFEVYEKDNSMLGFMDKRYYIKNPLESMEFYFNAMSSTNKGSMYKIMEEIRKGRIILSTNPPEVKKSTLLFMPLIKNKEVAGVILNISDIGKFEEYVDPISGDLKNKVTISDVNEFYTLLNIGLIVLHTEEIMLKEWKTLFFLYNEIMTNIVVSSHFKGGINKIDEMRLLIARFFTACSIDSGSLGQALNIPKDTISQMSVIHGKKDLFKDNQYPSLSDFCDAVNDEFTNISIPLSPKSLIGSSMTRAGLLGASMIDNYPTMLALMYAKVRKSRKLFVGGFAASEVFNTPVVRTFFKEYL